MPTVKPKVYLSLTTMVTALTVAFPVIRPLQAQRPATAARHSLSSSQVDSVLCIVTKALIVKSAMQSHEPPALIVDGDRMAQAAVIPHSCPKDPVRPSWLEALEYINPPTATAIYGPWARGGAIRITLSSDST
jgi:hypothetical protein